MALVDAVEEVESQEQELDSQSGTAPKNDGRPENTERPTSLSTGTGLPPYLHNQRLRVGGSLLLAISLMGALWLFEARTPTQNIGRIL